MVGRTHDFETMHKSEKWDATSEISGLNSPSREYEISRRAEGGMNTYVHGSVVNDFQSAILATWWLRLPIMASVFPRLFEMQVSMHASIDPTI